MRCELFLDGSEFAFHESKGRFQFGCCHRGLLYQTDYIIRRAATVMKAQEDRRMTAACVDGGRGRRLAGAGEGAGGVDEALPNARGERELEETFEDVEDGDELAGREGGGAEVFEAGFGVGFEGSEEFGKVFGEGGGEVPGRWGWR